MIGSRLSKAPADASGRAAPAGAPADHTGPARSAGNAPRTATPMLDSDALLRGHASVMITHRGAVYRLQATRQGKLILTK